MAKHPAKCPRCGNQLEVDTAVDEQIVCPQCQVSLSLPGKAKLSDRVDPLVGEKLGQFEILELLGRGGMGAVYKARQASLDRFVAIKVLPRAFARDASFVGRFDREARDAAAIRHPNIIEIHDVGEDRGFQYIAMEFIDGETLSEILKRDGRLPPERALEVMKAVVAALAEAHSCGIIHRDVKPSNILVTAKGWVKVADFGLAKRPGTDVTVTATGASPGTPLYFAPEVARGQPADARSDLYSLGATFYHLLAGRPPFQGGNVAELAARHIEARVPPLGDAAPDAPPALCRIIHRLLLKNPADRYPSAQEVLAALEKVEAHVAQPPSAAAAHLQGEPTRTMAGGVHRSIVERREAKAHARKKLLLLGGSAAGLVLVLVVVLVLALRPSSSPHSAIRIPQSAIPSPPTPTTQHPTPPPPKASTRVAQPPLRQGSGQAPAVSGLESAWKEADAKAKGLLKDERFGEAIALYEALGKLFDHRDLHVRVADTIANVNKQADTACREAERRSRQLLAEKKFGEARAALKPVIERYGVAWKAEQAKKTLEEIDAAEKAVAAKPPEAPKEDEAARKKAEEQEKQRQAEAAQRQRAEEAYAKALQPIDALAARWDFAAASEMLVGGASLPRELLQGVSRLSPRGPETARLQDEIERRLSTRRDELARLAKLKARFIARINAAEPKLDKRALMLTGMNGPVLKADERAITAKPLGGKEETHPWPDLTPKTLDRLIALTINRDSPDDWLSAGILFLTPVGGASLPRDPKDVGGASLPRDPKDVGGASLPRDAQAAEAAFDKAKALGASIDRYLDPLAAAAFARAKTLLAVGGASLPREGPRGPGPGPSASEGTARLQADKLAEALKALDDLEKKYGSTPWLTAHKDEIASARDAAKSAIAESEAEKLYAEAQKLFEKKELFDLKPLIEKLKTAYPATKPVTDTARKPAFAEMAKATKTLGRFLTVRKDGKGDFKTIQAAIDAAPPDSLVEIQDTGPYEEKILVPKEKEGLHLRGKKGCWPIITSAGHRSGFAILVSVSATGVTFERLVLAHVKPAGAMPTTLELNGGEFRFASGIMFHESSCLYQRAGTGSSATLSNCVLSGGAFITDRAEIKDSLWLLSGIRVYGGRATVSNAVLSSLESDSAFGAQIKSCTIRGKVGFIAKDNSIADSVLLGSVESLADGNEIENCDAPAGAQCYIDRAKPGKGCFSADPQFREPANFDYRLKPTSPCRKKASDGGDIGCRYTPEMLEVLEKALELRKKGIIKF